MLLFILLKLNGKGAQQFPLNLNNLSNLDFKLVKCTCKHRLDANFVLIRSVLHFR